MIVNGQDDKQLIYGQNPQNWAKFYVNDTGGFSAQAFVVIEDSGENLRNTNQTLKLPGKCK